VAKASRPYKHDGTCFLMRYSSLKADSQNLGLPIIELNTVAAQPKHQEYFLKFHAIKQVHNSLCYYYCFYIGLWKLVVISASPNSAQQLNITLNNFFIQIYTNTVQSEY